MTAIIKSGFIDRFATLGKNVSPPLVYGKVVNSRALQSIVAVDVSQSQMEQNVSVVSR